MPSFPIDNYLIQISGNDLLCDLNRWGDKIIQIYSDEKMLRLRISYETALMGLMQLFRTERYYSSRRAHNMRRLLTYCEMRNASILPGLLMPTQQSQTMAMPSSPLIKCQ